MLPRVNGYEVCRAIRARGLEMPIVMLTAKGQEEDIVLGLNLGADDYVTKPFRIGELVARANAFLRRSRMKATTVCRFDAFELNLDAHKLFRDGQEVELTAKEFRLLAWFAGRPGRALARNDILDGVWGRSIVVTQRSIDRCVATLRAKIEPDPRNPTYIHTIPEAERSRAGVGASVASFPVVSPSSIKDFTHVKTLTSHPKSASIISLQ